MTAPVQCRCPSRQPPRPRWFRLCECHHVSEPGLISLAKLLTTSALLLAKWPRRPRHRGSFRRGSPFPSPGPCPAARVRTALLRLPGPVLRGAAPVALPRPTAGARRTHTPPGTEGGRPTPRGPCSLLQQTGQESATSMLGGTPW
ncbi:hypothetical protein GQ607_004771 [Colletotrichum asianum]|uniref:Uncharacterized protein n=1 Tax=Colletotrichum asianum TaxID=702518 RepID=A0A8H3ZX95_9PEZI|nr:hypothetical protein GQ607_004771 [Colletotrichum asianum]